MGVAICEVAGEFRVSSEVLEELLFRPLLSRYPLSERRAIVCHGLYRGFQLERDAELGEVIQSWEQGACALWRREKMRRDCQEQLKRIDQHHEFLEQHSDRPISADEAARDWIDKHAANWRAWWEQQPESSPVVFSASLDATASRSSSADDNPEASPPDETPPANPAPPCART